MAELDLTPDEEYLRSYYLHCEQTRLQQWWNNYSYLLPALIFMLLAIVTKEQGNENSNLWFAAIAAIVGYVWRMGDGRWETAQVSLIRKYEARLNEILS